jgi:hypothetical protein
LKSEKNKIGNDISNELPKELRATYHPNQRSSPIIERLRMAAVLKLWYDRDFRDIRLNVPLSQEGKRFIVKVLAQNKEGRLFGVECVSAIGLGRLRKRITRLRACLPPESYLIAVFPYGADKRADRAVQFADEVWVTGKDGKVAEMMFMSSLGKE